MRESMSFPPFRFLDLASREWEDSDVYAYFSETRFLFVVYRRPMRGLQAQYKQGRNFRFMN